MKDPNRAQRVGYVFLCASPFLAFVMAAIRPLRISGVYHSIGIVIFAAFVIATWTLAKQAIRAGDSGLRLTAIAGTLLVLPFALIALLWVGLGPPFLANPVENQMRYLVLIAMATAVTGGSAVLKEALSLSGERVWSTLGFTGMILAGPLYLIGEALLLAGYSAFVRDGHAPEVLASLSEFQDILLFIGGVLIYAATGAFAFSLNRAGWLGRGVCRAYLIVSLIAVVFLMMRGLQFPDPAALSTPWYTTPGFIAGIPAVPFIMPCLLGAISLRRASKV